MTPPSLYVIDVMCADILPRSALAVPLYRWPLFHRRPTVPEPAAGAAAGHRGGGRAEGLHPAAAAELQRG